MSKEQREMFSQRDLAQFGVKARPQLSLAPTTQLTLETQDPRTKEEKERDEFEATRQQTTPMFTEEEVETSALLIIRTRLLKEAVNRGQKIVGMLEELQNKPQAALTFLAPVLFEQAQDLVTTIQHLLEPPQAPKTSSPKASLSRLGPRSGHTAMLIDGMRVLQPL